MWFRTGKYRFSENHTVDSYKKLRLWSVFHQKFFSDIYFDTWHLQWCQMTLFCILITAEYIWMVKYLFGVFLERNFLAIFILKSDTSSGLNIKYNKYQHLYLSFIKISSKLSTPAIQKYQMIQNNFAKNFFFKHYHD